MARYEVYNKDDEMIRDNVENRVFWVQFAPPDGESYPEVADFVEKVVRALNVVEDLDMQRKLQQRIDEQMKGGG